VTNFITKLEHGAEDAVKHVSAPKKKVGPDPPHHSKVDTPSSPHALPESDFPVTARPFVDHPALERALERSGVHVPPGDSARLIALTEERLAGRALDGLKAAEREALEDALRQELVRLSPGAVSRQQELIKQARALSRLGARFGVVKTSTAKVTGGTWVFFHSPSATTPVILSESFVPTKAGAPVPKRPTLEKAGITGTATWRDSAGRVSSAPPPLPVKPATMPSGLDPQALDQAPALILDEFARARGAALKAAERQAAPIKIYSLAPGTRRAGSRISKIEKFAPSQPGGGAWDELIVAEGVTGPEIRRMPDSEMDKVLPEIGQLTDAPELKGMARMHAFGPIFGDETLAGLAYGPHETANLLASGNTEQFARFGVKGAGRLNVKAGTPVKVSQYVKHRYVKGPIAGRYPFVVTVKYQYTLESGELLTAVIDISPTGKVTFFIDG
jgi:hypothetical protein